jgi:hypothetical protein
MSRAVRVILAIICALALCVRVESDANDVAFYLPLAEWSGSNMGIWQIVQPVATTNEVENPSFENNVTDGWTLTNGARAQTTDQSLWGSYSLEHTADGALVSTMTSSAISLADGASITASTWAYRGTTTPLGNISIRDTTTPDTRATTALTAGVSGEWERLIATWTNTTGGAVNVVIWLRNTTADGASIIYWDGVQAEPHDYATTYCDGDQDGCEWAGTAHNSSSDRSALSRAGGRVREFTDFNFNIGSMISTGAAPVNVNVDEFAILPGGQVQSFKIRPRVFTLTGVFRSTSLEQLHADRQGLYDLLKPDAVPETASGPQPVILRYSGADVEKEIFAHYESGLEAQIRAEIDCWERVGIRFIADDPFFYAVGENSDPLDVNDTVSNRFITARLRSTGQWTDIDPSAPAVGAVVYDILIIDNDTILVAGDFSNWDGDANLDNLALYTISTDTWSQLGGGAGADDIVRTLRRGADGTIYLGGDFTNIGGVAANRIAQYPIGGPFAAMSTGFSASVYDIEIDLDGTIFAGGAFNTGAGDPADYIAEWNGAAWVALADGGMNSWVYAITTASDNHLFVTGLFTTAGGTTVNRVAEHDGSDWLAMSTGLNNTGFHIIADRDSGLIYVTGQFTTAGGETANRIAVWNRTAWSTLGTGFDSTGRRIAIAPNGFIYAGGSFDTAGGVDLFMRIAKWNGSSWAHLDISQVSKGVTYAITIGDPDPVIEANFDVFLGFSVNTSSEASGLVTVTNAGTEKVFPRITINRSGGTTARLLQIRNEDLGLEMLFDYAILDGETLTIDFASTQKSITSSFFGNVPGALFASSDFGSFNLQSGDNDVSAFVELDGAPTMSAFIIWRDTYWSQD